ncbi:hypothetical protein GUJ93_ZPchr0007g3951 [Zizania palustris]|uniref:Uncharacterized protein n=1 Tax=Zizania palustris TaxID=103762 RepID=A0A8J5TCB9_ZIZPA|nr:hypothetical protein GUJ93_ZPchr0007g3951 [Zizania palustris]
MEFAWMVATAVAAAAASWALNAVVVHLVWRPRAIARRLRAQGVTGPDYRFYSGNLPDIRRLHEESASLVLDVASHDFIPVVQPYFHKYIPLYGRGCTPRASRICRSRGCLARVVWRSSKARVGSATHKVIQPAFNMDKLKMMTKAMFDCAGSMVSEWESKLVAGGGGTVEIELSRQFEELTADVISHTAFGSSYVEGKQVFVAQRELLFLALSTFFTVQFPGDTTRSSRYGNDLLGLMLESCAAPEHGGAALALSMDEIIDECKTFFFAGQDTTSHILTWTMFLLSTHPEWQEKLGEEVAAECGDQVPTGDMLTKLKLVNMFLLETLRLYSPVPLIESRAVSDLELGSGGVRVPEGTILKIPIATIHRDKDVWGDDADEFRPERFENGVSRAANHPNALLSFSSGPRACIGQNFAMMEAKVIIAMILQRFSFALSPNYVHAPTDVITLRPKYGLPMILKSLKLYDVYINKSLSFFIEIKGGNEKNVKISNNVLITYMMYLNMVIHLPPMMLCAAFCVVDGNLPDLISDTVS